MLVFVPFTISKGVVDLIINVLLEQWSRDFMMSLMHVGKEGSLNPDQVQARGYQSNQIQASDSDFSLPYKSRIECAFR